MTKRIQELAEQAKCMAEETINKQISKNAELDAFAEKFAQLIVLETLDQVNKNMELTWVDGEVKIKQHFGVEE